MVMSIPQCIIWKSQAHSVNYSIYDFHWVFLEIPEKNSIVGMLLTCPIPDYSNVFFYFFYKTDNIHTTLVSTAAMGHVDFYPNGGELGVPVLTWVHSHLQPIYIYTESINGHCSYTAYKCPSYQSLRTGGWVRGLSWSHQVTTTCTVRSLIV